MDKRKIKYYFNEKEDILGKCDGNSCFRYEDNIWKYDTRAHLAYGNKELLEKNGFRSISYEEYLEIINDRLVNELIDKWNNGFEKEKEEWNKEPLWPAKYVETSFILNNIKYVIYPSDIDKGVKGFNEGYMEYIQKYIEEDLREINAEAIVSSGFLD